MLRHIYYNKEIKYLGAENAHASCDLKKHKKRTLRLNKKYKNPYYLILSILLFNSLIASIIITS